MSPRAKTTGDGKGARRARARRGEGARRGAAGADQPPPLPVPRARRSRGRRRRVRRADARAPRRSRTGSPSCITPDSPDADGGRRRRGRPVRAGDPPGADALARQRVQLRGARGVGGARRARGRRRGALRVRAEDRRGRVRAHVRAGASGAGARRAATDASARTSRRTCARSAGIPRAPERRRPARRGRGPRRDVLPGQRVRGAERAAARGGRQGVREPAQRRRRVRCARRTRR